MNKNLFIKKYQPTNIEDFNLNPNLLHILNTFIDMNQLNILFIGDSGTGKTILIDAIIKKYYNQYSYNTYKDNILYINNLNGHGIDYFRNDVKIFCQTHSIIPDKKKLVILDDIDLINEQHQQVFRNIIDKYSCNIHFIASCSNIQKIIENIQSRFNLINILPVCKQELQRIMNNIIEKENIIMDEDAKNMLLTISNNTIKILINYLEKIKLLDKPINISILEDICTNISFTTFDTFTTLIKQKSLHKAIDLIQQLYDIGYSVLDILDNYFFYIKYTHLLTDNEKYTITPLICKYITIFNDIHENDIELTLFTNDLIDQLG
jgi:DNA polymerase III delta prime subunit